MDKQNETSTSLIENPEIAPSNRGQLIDNNLVAAAKAARSRVEISTIMADERRIIASFLARDDYQAVVESRAVATADLMLECLPAMIRELGGQVAWSMRMSSGERVNIILHAVEVAGKIHNIMRDGCLFIHLPDELIAIFATPTYRDKARVDISVHSSVDSANFHKRWINYTKKNAYLRGQVFFADGSIIERNRTYSWDDILLPKTTIKTIRTHVESFLNNRLRLRDMGVKMRRGLILAGPPGTGKTLLGKVLSDTLNTSFLWVSPRHIRTAESFDEIMTLARFVAPTVVFLEDLDLFGENREEGSWAGLGELMNQLDGVLDNEDIITIDTTNRLEVIEKALQNRPGRFDRIVQIGALDLSCRRRMLKKLLRHAELASMDFDRLIGETDDYTGAQLEELVNTLYILAIEDASRARKIVEDKPATVCIDSQLINRAFQECQVERTTRLGFHVA